jgi:predicted transposase YbfD/YdcC
LPADVWRSDLEKDHGRIEKREMRTEEGLSWMACKERRKGLKTIIQYRCARTAEDKTSGESRHYISGLPLDAEQAARLIRGHWSIENRLHWFL